MNKLLLLSGTLVSAGFLNAQTVSSQVIASDGGFASGAQGSIAWTIGEPVSETYANASNITTMGFHQPLTADIGTMIKEQGEDKQILVYPNPVSDQIYVDLTGIQPGNYNLELMDALGKLISTSNQQVTERSGSMSLKLSEVAAGAYFLRIIGKEFNKTVKIDKVNN